MQKTQQLMPMGMASDEKHAVKSVGDFGYADLMRQGILNRASSLHVLQGAYEPVDRFVKTDAPLLSTTTAAFNQVYGAEVWVWQNMQRNAFSALAKQPWTRSGIRVKTGNSSTLVSGLAESDALPASTLPTYAYMKFPLRQMVTRLDYTAKMQRLAAGGDDAIPTPDQLIKDKTEEHMLGLNTLGIMVNAESAAAGAAANYDGGSVFCAIDRLISCDAEEDDLGGTHVGWYDPWDGSSYDRDSGTTYDAVVVHGDGTLCYQTGSPNFTSDATLSLDVKDVLLQNCLKNGLQKENAFWLTGWDTYFRLKQLYEVKERIMNPVKVTFNVNGVSSPVGAEVGMTLSSMDDIPIIVDQNCPSDTISKLYLIDKSNIFMRIATPTVMLDLGYPALSTVGGTFFQRLAYGKILLTEGELVATRFNTSGKLCALK